MLEWWPPAPLPARRASRPEGRPYGSERVLSKIPLKAGMKNDTKNSLMAGRGMRMVELKKVIRKLREQLKSAGLTPVANDPLKEV